MPRQRDPNKGMVVAREACVITVGARPPVKEPMRLKDGTLGVINQRTGELVQQDSDRITDEGSEGIGYVFKPYQRVARSHPAVKDSPSSFMELSELDEGELELVVS